MKENLPRAKQQGAESAEQHRRKQNDAKAHTGNQVYSCGSLAPKLKKGKKGGCSDCEVCALRDMLLYHGGYNGHRTGQCRCGHISGIMLFGRSFISFARTSRSVQVGRLVQRSARCWVEVASTRVGYC